MRRHERTATRFWATSLLVVCVTVCSATVNGIVAYRSYGPVRVSCGTWTNDPEAEIYRWWVLGFVSGAGRELAVVETAIRETDVQAIYAWMNTYCLAHPLEEITTAAVFLVDELKAKAQK